MPRSMTGYGEGLSMREGGVVRVECRSVNHRYLDISVRLPSVYAAHESLIRTLVKEQVGRGRVEVRVTDQPGSQPARRVTLDQGLLDAWLDAIRALESRIGKPLGDPVRFIAGQNGILTVEDQGEDQELVEEQIREALIDALKQLNRMRETEGEHLALDLQDKTRELKDLVRLIALKSEEIPQFYREKLLQRAEELFGDDRPEWYSDQRLFAETALFADRASIDEEVTRLDAHTEAMSQALASDSPVGRQLDFLIQEMVREINTIGSKANDLEITQSVVAAKTLLEKIREQVQNIE
jgi:uncharacterized protein (TIGR00255 family)